LSKQLPVPLNERPYYNVDAIANSIASDDMYDCYLEPVPGIGLVTRRRPALRLFTDVLTGRPGDGLFYWEARGLVLAVSDGKVFNIAYDGSAAQLSGTFNGVVGTKVVFEDGQKLDGTPWLYMAAQGLTYTTDGVVLHVPTDGNTPVATHVGWINGKFIANEPNSNRWDFTDVNPLTNEMENDFWSSTDNPLTCEARGDTLSALFTAFLEVYAWGSEGLEIWQDDGATPFVPIQGGFTVAGIEGPYAYGKIDNTIFALCVIEGKRCIVRLNARSPQIVSEPIARILSEMEIVSDAFCDIISIGGISIALFSFPTAQQSWAYDYKNDTWLRWGYWNLLRGEHERFLGQHSCFAKSFNKHLIQSRVDGKIYELDRAIFQDDSSPIVSYRRTGWIDRGTWNRKRISQFIIKGKVNATDPDNPGTLMLRWRNDGSPIWSTFMDISLNPDSQGNFIIPLNRMGMYRARQYEFRLSDNVDLVLIGATEDVEVMRN
jgi:hypothetical protein